MTDFSALREAMVDCQIRPSDVTKFPIIEAMLHVPREAFVPRDKRAVAYVGDHVPLGDGRVVLDPRVLAKMLDVVDIQPAEIVLDVACGLGYGTAVLARMADFVVAVEEPGPMATEAQANLTAQGVDNAVVVEAPLADGAAKHGPYDAVILEAGVEDIPAELLDQIKEGGRICAIFLTAGGASGQCRIGRRIAGKIAWRDVFDATAPLLAGFEKKPEFSL